jgi:hypothetical protein
MELSPSWEPPIVQLLKNFTTFYGTRKFITVFTRALHWSLYWARSIQSIPPHSIPLRAILLLSAHLRLYPPSGLFPFGFPSNILHAFLFSPIQATCPSHLIILDLVILIIFGEENKLLSSTLCSFPFIWNTFWYFDVFNIWRNAWERNSQPCVTLHLHQFVSICSKLSLRPMKHEEQQKRRSWEIYSNYWSNVHCSVTLKCIELTQCKFSSRGLCHKSRRMCAF